MNADDLRNRLQTFQGRSAAIEAAVREGEPAIAAAIELLRDRNESVRWSCIRILSEIGDGRSVGPLIALIERDKNATDAANALRSITGQDFGEDAAAWRQWAVKNPALRTATDLGTLSDEALLAAATKGLPMTVTGGDGEYEVAVSMSGGRCQRVWVDFTRADPQGNPVVQLCTPCGDADARRYEWALKLNMTIPYAGIALASLDDKLCFAMVATYLRAAVHPEEIAKALATLAAHGDEIEKALGGEDRY